MRGGPAAPAPVSVTPEAPRAPPHRPSLAPLVKLVGACWQRWATQQRGEVHRVCVAAECA
jgi:hypothetical protein